MADIDLLQYSIHQDIHVYNHMIRSDSVRSVHESLRACAHR